MRTRRRTILATGLVALLTIAGITAAIANDPPPRIAFLANGIVPADALAAGPIAGQLGAPIFTTAPDTLVEATSTALTAYAPELVIVMGGPVAISDAVLGQVSAATGLSVVAPNPPPATGIVRAAGQDRFETAAAAAALLAAYNPAYLPTDMQAADSDLLDGQDSSAFQPAGDYLPVEGKAVASVHADTADTAATLDGLEPSAFLGAEIIRREDTKILPDGTARTAVATCQTGEVFLGGGGSVLHIADDVRLVSSYPSSSVISWMAQGWNFGGGPVVESSVTAYALCASFPAG